MYVTVSCDALIDPLISDPERKDFTSKSDPIQQLAPVIVSNKHELNTGCIMD